MLMGINAVRRKWNYTKAYICTRSKGGEFPAQTSNNSFYSVHR